MNNVRWIRADVANFMPQYALISDCLAGEVAIKGIVGAYIPNGMSLPSAAAYGGAGGSLATLISNYPRIDAWRSQRYLPMPNFKDQSPENIERYRDYVIRAVFYGATSRTLDGMTGQVFQRDPVVDIPKALEDVALEDADGSGVGLIQLSMRAVRYVLPYGRAGILVDYPETEGDTTKAQVQDGSIRPVIKIYPPWDVINWRTIKVGAKQILSLVVLRERYTIDDDDFESVQAERFRVLRLDDNNEYFQELYEPDGLSSRGKVKATLSKTTFPIKDAAGNPLKELPFMFIGSENNDCDVDKPPMYDIASINVAHYRNSADYEESCHMTGQPTLALTGLTQDWVDNVLKGAVRMGARTSVPLPIGADIKIVQPDPNTMPKDAMDQKERHMVALGAKLVQQQQVQRTATESIMEGSSETSILANVARNVSKAFQWALIKAMTFIESSEAKVEFQLNTQFELAQLSADDQSKLIAGWQKGAYTFSEMRAVLRKAGVATKKDDEALAEIATEQAVMTAAGAIVDPFAEVAVPGQTSAPNVDPTNPNPSKTPAKHATQRSTRGQGA